MSRLMQRAERFCSDYGLKLPILLAPMAGACPASLSIAVANAGGLGACGALMMQPAEIVAWAEEFRRGSNGPFQLNTWIPDPEPVRDPDQEAAMRAFLAQFGPEVPASAGDAVPPDFESQCEAFLKISPPIVSSVMGLYSAGYVDLLKRQGIRWFANVSTVYEAVRAEQAGADVVVVQGMEAGGHRGCFDAQAAEQGMVGLFSLVPAVVDAVQIPVVATGGIADARGIAAAFMLGASAVQIGTGFLRTPEAKIAKAWADGLARTLPEGTAVTRAFSGRAGRSISTAYVRAVAGPEAPPCAPYPVQRGLTAPMRAAAGKDGDVERMQAWSGQSAALARNEPAEGLTKKLWAQAQELLPV